MQEKHLFEYAVIRVVPQVEREEFMNVGVVLYCARPKYLHAMFTLNEQRIEAFCPRLDAAEIGEYLQAMTCICRGGADAGPIGMLPAVERFRWLTAARSTVVQCSRVHPGFCKDPQQELLKLYEQLVL